MSEEPRNPHGMRFESRADRSPRIRCTTVLIEGLWVRVSPSGACVPLAVLEGWCSLYVDKQAERGGLKTAALCLRIGRKPYFPVAAQAPKISNCPAAAENAYSLTPWSVGELTPCSIVTLVAFCS
jgi:hypothetical protein